MKISMKINVEVNERLRELRKLLGLTQKQFASQLHLSGSHINEVEHNRINLSKSHLLLLCLVYGVNQEWLENGKGNIWTNKNWEGIGTVHPLTLKCKDLSEQELNEVYDFVSKIIMPKKA